MPQFLCIGELQCLDTEFWQFLYFKFVYMFCTFQILKLPKQFKRREPLQDLNIRLHSAEDTSTTGHLCTKKVSFHRAIQTK